VKWLAGEFVSKTRSKSMRFGEPKMVEWPKEARLKGGRSMIVPNTWIPKKRKM
jgi:hypothetical protein